MLVIPLEAVKELLVASGVEFDEIGLQHGATQFRCATGEVFDHFPQKNKLVIGGTSQTVLADKVRAFAERTTNSVDPSQGRPPNGNGARRTPGPLASTAPEVAYSGKHVFIVYGHDADARKALELLLLQMGLKPVILGNQPAGGDTLIEKLERHLDDGEIGYACVLLTPDDEGFPKGKTEERQYRARQNVILELGMVVAKLSRKRVAILHKKSLEIPSDLHGLLYLPFEEEVSEIATRLHRELAEAGLSPDLPPPDL